MNRYRAYGNLDDQPESVGDTSLLGVDEYNVLTVTQDIFSYKNRFVCFNIKSVTT